MGIPMTMGIITTTIMAMTTGTPVATTTTIILMPTITDRTSISAKAPQAPKCRG